MRLFDAHNHLQDERFAGRQPELIRLCQEHGVVGMVVNGSCQADWPAVATLARAYPDLIQPAFGMHPWYLHERTRTWKEELESHLDAMPHATVGEIGLDRWILDSPPASRAGIDPALATLVAPPLAEQLEIFQAQLEIAAARNLPASIHCLQAWGALDSALRSAPRLARGFLLHSYGGPIEMVPGFAALGAYFGFPGYFLHPRKARQREAFRAIPADRRLIETDAPDQRLPEPFPALTRLGVGETEGPLACRAADGRALNHPANLRWVCLGLADFLALDPPEFAQQLERNHRALFGAPSI